MRHRITGWSHRRRAGAIEFEWLVRYGDGRPMWRLASSEPARESEWRWWEINDTAAAATAQRTRLWPAPPLSVPHPKEGGKRRKAKKKKLTKKKNTLRRPGPSLAARCAPHTRQKINGKSRPRRFSRTFSPLPKKKERRKPERYPFRTRRSMVRDSQSDLYRVWLGLII